jgi:hypothetical protein
VVPQLELKQICAKDATHELEELLLEDNPLKAKKRNPNLDINTLSAEMRLMEEVGRFCVSLFVLHCVVSIHGTDTGAQCQSLLIFRAFTFTTTQGCSASHGSPIALPTKPAKLVRRP